MPKHNIFEVNNMPLHISGKPIKITKAYTRQDFNKKTVLTNDVFTYVRFYFMANKKKMKFLNPNNKTKYGNPNQFGYEFYWNQSEIFYKVSNSLPVEAKPVAAYYCMLNAVKAYLSFTSKSADEFVEDFGNHGLFENQDCNGTDLDSIEIAHRKTGVFPLFARHLDDDFDTLWINGKGSSKSLRCLLYNLPFVHRAYSMTYSGQSKKIDELFIPVKTGESPQYYKANDGKAYVLVNLEKSYFPINAQTIPNFYIKTIGNNFKVYSGFTMISNVGVRYNSSSISKEMKENTEKLRKNFAYIRSDKRLWYLKRIAIQNDKVINLSTLTLNMAALHRISEIARYKPEQLNRLLKSKENWLLHEYISQALDQFLDEISAEITRQDIMSIGHKM